MSGQTTTKKQGNENVMEQPAAVESRALVPVGRNLPSETDLTSEINDLLVDVQKGTFRSLEAYSKIGEKLVLAKDTLPYGHFEPWASKFSFGKTWRARMMKIAGKWERLRAALMDRERAWGELGKEVSLDGAVEFLAHLDACEAKGIDPNHKKFRPATKDQKKEAATAKREAKRAAEEAAKAASNGAGEGEGGEAPAPVEAAPKRRAAELIVEVAALTQRNTELQTELAKALARAEAAERQAQRLREHAQIAGGDFAETGAKVEPDNIVPFDGNAATHGKQETTPQARPVPKAAAKRGPGRPKKAAAAAKEAAS